MASFRQHLRAIWNKQCPRCFQGAIYESGMKMHLRCPVCGLLLERERGYFMGAMYISYALASVILSLGACIIYLLAPNLDLGLIVLLAGIGFVPFVPAVTRFSRVIWIHFDRWAWPDQSHSPR
jgi:uncharacterized protein (DUF983 family)